MRNMFSKFIPFMLVIALMLPVCGKAFAQADGQPVSPQTLFSDDGAPAHTPLASPCLSCCGGWTAIVPDEVGVSPLQRKYIAASYGANIVHLSGLPETANFHGRAPPDILIPRHHYSYMYALTGRLLL
jgi:hypothetical protein